MATLTLVCVAALGWSLTQTNTIEPGQSLIFLIVAALGLELLAVPLPPSGFFTAAPACYLALILLPEGGVAIAALAAVGAIGLRTVARGLPSPRDRMQEALTDALPILVTAALARSLPPNFSPWLEAAATVSLYLGLRFGLARRLSRTLPAEFRLEWYRTSRRLTGQRVAVAVAGVALAHSPGLPALLALAPLLWVTHKGARATARETVVEDVEEVEAELLRSRRALQQARGSIIQERKHLHATQTERILLEDFTRALHASPGLEGTLDVLVDTATRLGACRSAAVFLPDGDELFPARYNSPETTRVESARLLKLREPIVEEAWQVRGTAQGSSDLPKESRIFEGDDHGIAISLQDEGVLYAGKEAARSFSEEQFGLLYLLASNASLAIQSARRYQSQQEALQLHSEAHRSLGIWVRRLDSLLVASRAMVEALNPENLFELVEKMLRQTVPHQSGLVVTAVKTEPVRRWGGLSFPRAVVDTVLHNARPLLLDDLQSSRFSQDADPALRSLLAVPMSDERGAVGVILLGSEQAGAFLREHQDVLSLVACQAAVAFSNARLYREAVDARKKLEESQAQLVQSGKMAAVGELAAGVAHELNTPLGAILLSIDSAAARTNDPELVERKLNRAREAARRAKKIIENLLIFSRRSEERQAQLHLSQVIEDALEIVAPQLRLAEIAVEKDFTPGLRVRGNANELQQVLMNLILNARDAIRSKPTGGRHLRIFTEMDQNQVILGVKDSGTGIAPENRERLFEPFFTTKPVGKGTGLGLSISHQIVLEHGGRLEVESTPGEGALFKVYLPCA